MSNMADTKERKLTVPAAAKELGYNPQTVYRKIRDGVIKAQKFGRDVRILPSENAELWAQRRELLANESAL